VKADSPRRTSTSTVTSWLETPLQRERGDAGEHGRPR
jgi:hypothetical protein